MLYECIARNYW